MCAPLALAAATLAITAISTGATLYSQAQNQSYQEEVNQKQADNINTTRRANLANIEVQRQQIQADAREQVNKDFMAGRAATSTATVAAGESGVTGTSVDALLRELQGKAAWDSMTAETNYLRQDTALNAQRENIINNSNSQLNSLTTPASPNYLGAALKIGQAGLDAYSGYQKDMTQQALLRGIQTK